MRAVSEVTQHKTPGITVSKYVSHFIVEDKTKLCEGLTNDWAFEVNGKGKTGDDTQRCVFRYTELQLGIDMYSSRETNRQQQQAVLTITVLSGRQLAIESHAPFKAPFRPPFLHSC